MIRRLLIALCVAFVVAPALAEPLVISLSEAVAAHDPATGQPIIRIQMTTGSAGAFADFTRRHVGRTVDIRIDGRTIMSPAIREPILGGSAVLSGDLTDTDAADLARRLATGDAVIEVDPAGSGHGPD